MLRNVVVNKHQRFYVSRQGKARRKREKRKRKRKKEKKRRLLA